jgi:hypothetical protein
MRGATWMDRAAGRAAIVAALSAVLAGLPVGSAGAWEVPLAVENSTRAGVPPFVSGGVPLLPGQAKDVTDLRLAVKDATGRLTVIPAQFRVLARWWRGDNSIRWVLVDFAAANVPGEKTVVYLTGAEGPALSPKVEAKAVDGAETVVVSTGVAAFTISKKKFNLFQSAVIDGQELLDGSADLGTVIEDILGETYYAAEGTRSVEVLENGPVRVCVRARGQHLARDGKGYSRGMYGYDVFMNFYAGSSEVGLDVIVTNNFRESIGEPLMKDASFLIRLAGGATGCRVYGAAPLDARLSARTSLCLYQDSNGGETWQTCQGYTGDSRSGGMSYGGKSVSFRGYRVLRRAGEKEDVIAAGDQARGLMHLFNERGGVVLLMRNFWQQFPKAVEAGADGTLRLGLFPRESVLPHYLDDASAKGHEILLHFYAKGKTHGYAADPNGRTWPHVVADLWDTPALPRPPLEHIAATGALSDLGPFTPPTSGFADHDTAVNLRRLFMTDEYWGNGLGWQVYGERWKSHGGHSTRGARQPIEEDHFLRSWYWTGGPGWLDAGINRSRQFRDVRAYRIDDQDALAFKDWAEFRTHNTSEGREWTSRPIPNDAELKKYQAGMYRRARWEFPNPEHCTLDLLYDRYLLFGDQRAFENMRVVAGHGGFFALGTAPRPTAQKVGGSLGRSQGWSWRALERYWELTGDPRADQLLKAVIRAYEPLIGKAPLWFADDPLAHASDWFTQIFSRAAAMTALHTGDPKALDICKSLAEGKEKPSAGSVTYGRQSRIDARQFSALFAVLYHLTGDEKYRDAVLTPDGGRSLLSAAGRSYFLPSDHFLLTHPPRAK